jgi:hypothetical protein
MAKVKFGGIAQDARGKIDGIVYSRNQYGSYVRVKVSPVQPNSARQTLIRERTTTLSKRFSTVISEAQRAAWSGFATANPVPDVFGNPQALSGITSYVRLNQVVLNAGGTIIDTPPADLQVPGLLSLTAAAYAAGVAFAATEFSYVDPVLTMTVTGHTFAVGQKVRFSGFTGSLAGLNGTDRTIVTAPANTLTFSIAGLGVADADTGTLTSVNQLSLAFTPTPLGAGLRLYIFATAGKGAGVHFFRPFFRWIGISGAAQISPYDAGIDYVARFGSLVAGQAIGVTVAVVDRTKGAVTPGIFQRVIVA